MEPPKFKCKYCRKFKTKDCSLGIDFVSGDDPADPRCFELREIDNYVQFFSELILEQFTVKHFIKGGNSIGLYMWNDGSYVPCEEFLKAWVEYVAKQVGVDEKIKTHTVNEIVGKVERSTYCELNEEPMRIAFKNIVLDWKEFLEGNRERAFLPLEETKANPCFHKIPHRFDICLFDEILNYEDFEKACLEKVPEIVKIFKEWVGDNWRILFEIIGYCLYPSYPFHKAFMLVGDGANGKSTYLRLVKTILGEENVVSVSLQDICNNRFSQALLYHKLANIYADLPSKPLGYTGYFKILTGEDLISADRKFKDRITFRNYAKLLFSANELPEVRDMTHAFWRRWIVIEFPNQFPEDPDFFERTFTEEVIEKIITLSLVAFVEVWIKRKFSIEGESTDFKEKWLRKTNSVYAYIKEGVESGRIELDKEARVEPSTLYLDYQTWCEENDRDPVSKQIFTMELERQFRITKKRVREGGRLTYAYVGIRLKDGE